MDRMVVENFVTDKRIRIMIAVFRDTKAYFINFLITLLAYPVFVLAMYFLWAAIYSASEIPGMSFLEMITYYSITYMVASFVVQRGLAFSMSSEVVRGTVAVYQVRPISYLAAKFWGSFINFLLYFCVAILILICAGLFFPLAISTNAVLWALFVIAAFLGFVLYFLLFFIIGTTALWIEKNRGVIEIYQTAVTFLSGIWIPLELFPALLQQASYILPFRFGGHFPVSVLMGRIPLDQTLILIFVELVWIAALFLFGRWLWKKGERRFTGYGI